MCIYTHIMIIENDKEALRTEARARERGAAAEAQAAPTPGGAVTVGFYNINLRIFNLRVTNPNKFIGLFFGTMSDFNVPGSRPKNTMTFLKSTVLLLLPLLLPLLASQDYYHYCY